MPWWRPQCEARNHQTQVLLLLEVLKRATPSFCILNPLATLFFCSLALRNIHGVSTKFSKTTRARSPCVFGFGSRGWGIYIEVRIENLQRRHYSQEHGCALTAPTPFCRTLSRCTTSCSWAITLYPTKLSSSPVSSSFSPSQGSQCRQFWAFPLAKYLLHSHLLIGPLGQSSLEMRSWNLKNV